MVISSRRMVSRILSMASRSGPSSGAAAGMQMAAAAKSGRDVRHVQTAFAAQRKAHAMVGQLAQQNRRFDAADADGVIDDSLAVFFGSAGCGSYRHA